MQNLKDIDQAEYTAPVQIPNSVVREQCAKLAEDFRDRHWIAHDIKTGIFPNRSEAGVAIAAAIRALSAEPAQLSPDFAKTIAYVIKEESLGGAACGWKSCSGCLETSEGQHCGDYPYSDLFKTHVGFGCSDCGGLGVVWEYSSKSCLDEMQRELKTAEPAQGDQSQTPEVEWEWWGGYNEEMFSYGPHKSREAVIEEALQDRLGEFQAEDGSWKIGVYICEAQQAPLRLADWIDDNILERAEENISDSYQVSSEYDEGPWFECTPSQQSDLETRIKAACDAWQATHNISFVPSTFSDQRNLEHVVLDHPDNETSAAPTTEAGR